MKNLYYVTSAGPNRLELKAETAEQADRLLELAHQAVEACRPHLPTKAGA